MKNLFMVSAIVTLIFSGSAFPQQKATIAVGGIEYRAKDSAENKHYRAYGQDPREDTRAFVDMLTTALVKTKKFNVIERDRMTEILKEQGLSLEGIAKGGYAGDGLNLKGIDYILTGSITEYGIQAQGVQFGGFSTAGETAVMAVDIRVLEIATGSIGIAESVRAEASGGSAFKIEGFASGAESDSSAQLGEVMRKSARNVTNLIVTTIYPIKVVTIDKNGDAMLNYGDSLLQEGDVLEVFSQGEEFIDPDTGEVLGREEVLIGKLSVFDVQARFSKAKILEKSDSIEAGAIARITEEEVDSKGQTKKKKKKLKLF